MRAGSSRRKLAVLAVAGLLAAPAALPAPEAAHAYSSPAIWVGSPVVGTWGRPGDASTLPPSHHRVFKASPQNDWSVDLSSIPSNDRGVYLYVAPSNSALNGNVTAKVSQIIDDQACRYGGGADLVTVGIYYNGTLYGHASYTHLDRDPSLYVGKPLNRWGTWLGNVAWSAAGGSNCWTGPHVHFEMRAQTQYACWNRGYSYAGYPVGRTNFLGFLSGPLSTSAKACP